MAYPSMGSNLYGMPYQYQPPYPSYNPMIGSPPLPYPAAMQQQQPDNTGTQQYTVRPVTSEDEAKAVLPDFGGGITIMPDLPHNTIYVKRLDARTGSSIFIPYRVELPKEQDASYQQQAQSTPAPDYVPRSEFEALKAELAQLQTLFAAPQAVEKPKQGAKGADK